MFLMKFGSIVLILAILSLSQAPLAAQNNEAVTIRLSIDWVIAHDLQEDGGFWADRVDEIVIIYALQEIDWRGQAVTDNRAAVVWAGDFVLGQRVNLPQFEVVYLTIDPTSSVRLEILMLETEGDTDEYLEVVQLGCGIAVSPLMGSAIAGNLYAVGGVVACLLVQALNFGDTEFNSEGAVATYGLDALPLWQQALDFRWRFRILGRATFNEAHYELHYSLSIYNPDRPAA